MDKLKTMTRRRKEAHAHFALEIIAGVYAE